MTLQLDISCPRLGLKYDIYSQQFTDVAMIDGICCIRLDWMLQVPLNRPTSHCTADLSIERLQVRLLP